MVLTVNIKGDMYFRIWPAKCECIFSRYKKYGINKSSASDGLTEDRERGFGISVCQFNMSLKDTQMFVALNQSVEHLSIATIEVCVEVLYVLQPPVQVQLHNQEHVHCTQTHQ